MLKHRLLLEHLTRIIDRVGGRFEPSDPFQRFRRRSFIVMLLILALICLIQATTAWFGNPRALAFLVSMGILFGLVVVCLLVTRRMPNIEITATVVLIFLVVAGALVEIAISRSPNTPLLYWSPVILFGGYVFCGRKRGSIIALCIILSTAAIIAVPFVVHDAHVLPKRAGVDAYQKRLFVTVLLCHLLPLMVLGTYEKFFALCHEEARIFLDKLEGRKDRAYLARLAQVIVRELEPELERMEQAYSALPKGHTQAATDAVLQPLQRLVHLTRRYEPLSTGALTAVDKGLTLQDFPRIMQRFTDFPDIAMGRDDQPELLFQGGETFFLLIFLCIALRELMENPQLTLQNVVLHRRPAQLELSIDLWTENQDLRMPLAQDFLHDMDARVRMIPLDKGTSSHRLEIEVPLA